MNRRTFLSTIVLATPILVAGSRNAFAAKPASNKPSIDNFSVSADGTIAVSTTQLRVGKKYSIVIGGIRQYSYYFDALGALRPVEADAMYGLKADRSLDYRAPVIQIDTDVTTDTIARSANVESFASHHYVFHVVLTGVAGTSRAVQLRVLDSAYYDNAGSHSVQIFKGHLKKVPSALTAPDENNADDSSED